MNGRIFISHSSEDAAAAGRILAYLEARGAACWIASRDIPPRAIYADAIAEALQASSACAVILSHAANRSKAVKRELELASHYDKPFIPIRVDDAEPAAGLDYYLRNTQWVDYRGGGERALDRIIGTTPLAAPAQAAMPITADTPQSAIVPTSTSAHRRPPLLVFAGGATIAVVVVAGAVWLGWGRSSSTGATASDQPSNISSPQARAALPAPESPASPLDIAAEFLIGSYRWEGLACGAGPTITRLNDALVFTMPGTVTYRHKVLSVTPFTSGYALRVETRVLEPTSSRGEAYVLGASAGARTLEVITGGRTDTWDRCPAVK